MINLSNYKNHTYKGKKYYTLERENDTLIIGEITPNGKQFAFIAIAEKGKSIDDAIQEELDFRQFKKDAKANKDNLLLKFETEKFFTYKGIAHEFENPNELHLLALEGEGEWKTRRKLKQGETLSETETKQVKWLSGMNLL